MEGGCLGGESGGEFHDAGLQLDDGVLCSISHGSLGFSVSCAFAGEVFGGGCVG